MKAFKIVLYWFGVLFLGLMFLTSFWKWLNNLENLPNQNIGYSIGSTLAVVTLGWLFWWIMPTKNKVKEE